MAIDFSAINAVLADLRDLYDYLLVPRISMLITSKYQGRCRSCGGFYDIGDQIAWDPQTRGVWHPTCAPTGVADPPRRSRSQPAQPGSLASRDRAQDAALTVLAALEEAIVLRAEQLTGVEMERAWERYQKCKALALAPGTEGEGLAALRTALIEAIKIAF